MIKTFGSKETEMIFNRHRCRKLPPDIQRPALRKLTILHKATSLTDLRVPPSNHLEKLSGNRKGQWSIRINNQWRICFKWIDNNAFNIEIVDYH